MQKKMRKNGKVKEENEEKWKKNEEGKEETQKFKGKWD